MITAILIGAGARGMDAYAAYALQNPGRMRVVAVAEPRQDRRAAMARAHQIPPERCFDDWRPLLALGKIADCCLVCTQDRQHVAPAEAALALGYHVLCEKPMHPEAKACIQLVEAARASGKTLTICHVLRYSPFFAAIKRLLDEGRVGRVAAVQHIESVGFFHQAHSFVRGNWRNSHESSPMILQKSCHDMDILLWLLGKHCLRVSSYGSLLHFTPENAPAGSTERCYDGCPHTATCPYFCGRLYAEEAAGFRRIVCRDESPEALTEALRIGPYGRCVYRCDNDVVDHQVVNLLFEDGITASFTMCAFTARCTRLLNIMGTHGQIQADMEKNEIVLSDFVTGNQEKITVRTPRGGHSGSDTGLMEGFVRTVESDGAYQRSSAEDSLESHLMALAAEESRLTGKTVDLEEFRARHSASGAAPQAEVSRLAQQT